LGKLYHIEGSVDYMADLKTVALGAAVVDSSTARLAAGLAFRGFVSGQGGLGGIDGRLGLAFPFSDAVAIGLSGRYINVESEAGKDAGFARSQRLVKGFTMDASLRIAPIPELQLDIAAYNFINRESLYAPIMIGGGASVALGEIGLIGADMLVDLTSYDSADFIVGGGVELLAAQIVPVRAGYSYETLREQHTLTLGLGYTDRAVGFDISLRQQLGGGGDTRIMGAFRIYVR
jgi:opacity protein-like surface antigen